MVCAVSEGKQSLRLLLFVLGFLLFLSGTQFKHLGFFGRLFVCLFIFCVKCMHLDVVHIISYEDGWAGNNRDRKHGKYSTPTAGNVVIEGPHGLTFLQAQMTWRQKDPLIGGWKIPVVH